MAQVSSGIGSNAAIPVAGWQDRIAPYGKYLLLAPLVIIIVGFFAGPLVWLFRVSLFQSRGASGFGLGGAEGGGYYVEGTWTLENYIRFFQDDYYQAILGFTVEFAVLVTIITMLMAYPMAYYIYKAGPKLKVILLILVILPKISNMLVLVYGLQIMFANRGLVNDTLQLLHLTDEPIKMVYTLFSITVSKVLLIAPYTILVITAALHTLDATLREAARGLPAA